MIACRKAQEHDLEKVIYAILSMRNDKKDNRSLTPNEMRQYLDHTYYLEDTESKAILAVICGYRRRMDQNFYDPANSVMIGMRRYEIPYFLSATDDESALAELVREFLADMNDFPTVYRNTEDDVYKIHALRVNGFVCNRNLKVYMRMPGVKFDRNSAFLK